jgi:hypothetical protein
MHNSQEDVVDRDNVDYDISACDRVVCTVQWLRKGLVATSHLSLTTNDASKEVVVHRYFVFMVIFGNVVSIGGHRCEIE